MHLTRFPHRHCSSLHTIGPSRGASLTYSASLKSWGINLSCSWKHEEPRTRERNIFPSSRIPVPISQFRAVSSQFPDPKQLPAPVVAGSQLPFPKPRRLPDPGVGGIQKFKKVVLGLGAGGWGAGGWGQCGGEKIPKLDLRIPNFAGAGIDYP